MTDRGQTFTLEAFVAAILLVATVAFALQAVAVTANTASGANTEPGNQHAGIAAGVLDEAVENGSLRATLLYWDEDAEQFYGADPDDGYYLSEPPHTTLGESLERAFDDRQIRYNVDLHYSNEDGDRETQRLVESGTPSDDAVRIVETVTLYDDTPLVDENEQQRSTTLGDVDGNGTAAFYAPNAAEETAVYNVIRVEVVLWQS